MLTSVTLGLLLSVVALLVGLTGLAAGIQVLRIAKKERAQLAADLREVPGDYLVEAIEERWSVACETDPVQQWLCAADEQVRHNLVVINNSRLVPHLPPCPAVGQLWVAPFSKEEADTNDLTKHWNATRFGKEVVVKQVDGFVFYHYLCDGSKGDVLKKSSTDFSTSFKFLSHGT